MDLDWTQNNNLSEANLKENGDQSLTLEVLARAVLAFVSRCVRHHRGEREWKREGSELTRIPMGTDQLHIWGLRSWTDLCWTLALQVGWAALPVAEIWRGDAHVHARVYARASLSYPGACWCFNALALFLIQLATALIRVFWSKTCTALGNTIYLCT